MCTPTLPRWKVVVGLGVLSLPLSVYCVAKKKKKEIRGEERQRGRR
jgi:hypothetical protein